MSIRKQFVQTVVLMAVACAICCDGALAQHVAEHESETIQVQPLVAHYRPEEVPRIDGVVVKIVQETNQFRERHGCGQLVVSPELTAAANRFALYMSQTDRYGHEADGSNPQERAQQQGYQYCIIAENIAYDFNSQGFSTGALAESLVTGWEHSPPHRRNMLDPDVDDIGVSVAESEHTGVFYAVQMFGRPRSKRIEFSIFNDSDHAARYALDAKEFMLPPGYTRTHERCRPPELRFEADGQFAPVPELAGRTFVPRSHTEFALKNAGDHQYTLERHSQH